jgi:hypothetical protein
VVPQAVTVMLMSSKTPTSARGNEKKRENKMGSSLKNTGFPCEEARKHPDDRARLHREISLYEMLSQ